MNQSLRKTLKKYGSLEAKNKEDSRLLHSVCITFVKQTVKTALCYFVSQIIISAHFINIMWK